MMSAQCARVVELSLSEMVVDWKWFAVESFFFLASRSSNLQQRNSTIAAHPKASMNLQNGRTEKPGNQLYEENHNCGQIPFPQLNTITFSTVLLAHSLCFAAFALGEAAVKSSDYSLGVTLKGYVLFLCFSDIEMIWVINANCFGLIDILQF